MKRVNLALTAAFLLGVAGIVCYAIGRATVSVDVNTQHQKITEFGACSAWNGTLTAAVGEQLFSTTGGQTNFISLTFLN